MDPTAFDVMITALRERRIVQYRYRKPGQAKFQLRTVHPWAFTTWRGAWYMVGFCERAQKERTFHLSRLRDVKLLNKRYTIPEWFHAKEHFKKCFGVQKGTGDYRVVVKLSPVTADIYRHRRWHATQQWEDLEDGCALVSFRLTSLVEIKYTILGWGDGATVLGPPELVREMMEILRRMLACYEGAGDAGLVGGGEGI